MAEDPGGFGWRNLSNAVRASMICGVLGLVVSISTTSTGPDGCAYLDYGALFGAATGAIAAAIGLATASAQAPPVSARSTRIIALAGLAVALVNVLRGIGILAGPC